MKELIPASLLVAAALLAGCASEPHGLVLDPIGPPVPPSPGAGSNGTLVVFSAFDPQADFDDLPYLRHYSDYKITDQDGKRLQRVHNAESASMEGPKQVQLPAGAYHVLARANVYGIVTVPVIIRAGQVTTVHLEGGASWQNRAQLTQSDPVRLPDGRIVGWRANSHGSAAP
jgi:hypothetical protein